MSPENPNLKLHQTLGENIEAYCRRYGIPVEFLIDILNDQKVVPMMRGKGMEYSVYLRLKELLDANLWIAEKLNLSAQPGMPDQDIGITSRRTGRRFTVESKSAVRGSMQSGQGRTRVKVVHFKVKCHRSRSNMKKATNDRYHVGDFEVLITNPQNALFQGGTVGEELELIDDPKLMKTLRAYYGAEDHSALIEAAGNDWRFVLSRDIAEDDYIPRTPVICLQDDPHWRPLSQLPDRLEEVVRSERGRRR